MTNDEFRMTKETPNPKIERKVHALVSVTFGLRASFAIRHFSFVISTAAMFQTI